MRRATLPTLAVAILTVTVLAVRAIELAGAPAFEVDVVLHRRPDLRIRGAQLGWAAAGRRVIVGIDDAAPDADRMGHLALGPSRFLALRGVRVECRDENGRATSLRAREGSLRGYVLTLTSGVRLRDPDGAARNVSGARVHLPEGRITAE